MQRTKRLKAVGALLTAAFSVYVLLDSFVIEHRTLSVENDAAAQFAVQTDAPESETVCLVRTAARAGNAEQEDDAVLKAEETVLALPDGAEIIGRYADEDTSITLYTFRFDDTQVYAADVRLSSARYLKTAFADSTYGRNVTDKTSSIAQEAGALLAVNGDYYGARRSGYVIRNGVLYRDSAADGEMLLIRTDGSFEILSASAASAEELLSDGAWQVLCFGPGLVEDGEIAVTEGEEVGHAMASNPRTAIGTLGEGHYLFLVSDGRTAESKGLSLSSLSALLAQLGCREAYNLDGGGSSTMVFMGEVVNNPTTNGKRISERSVSDIVYIG
ncbi:MAG: phosphodiester glycosidase family protein [Oscillospiraceae bacterium]|nr:phosphodiester glycosidase family protein [Oscillospiraceae bacterium]